MIKKRVIPILLYDGEYCVQTTRFKRPVRRLGPITQYVNNMADRDIDELIILDINCTQEYRPIKYDKIKEFTSKLMCPVTYGGGIRTLDDITLLIKYCGVDKVAIKTNYALISSAAEKFGKQAIVYAMDCFPHHSNGTHFIHTQPKSQSPTEWVERIQECGAGEILLTCMIHNGQQYGYNYLLINQIAKYCKVPLIANGGCGSVEHMVRAFEAGADAVAASSVFCLTDLTPRDAAKGLLDAGLYIRLDRAERRQ